jgi:hypothetical protein
VPIKTYSAHTVVFQGVRSLTFFAAVAHANAGRRPAALALVHSWYPYAALQAGVGYGECDDHMRLTSLAALSVVTVVDACYTGAVGADTLDRIQSGIETRGETQGSDDQE